MLGKLRELSGSWRERTSHRDPKVFIRVVANPGGLKGPDGQSGAGVMLMGREGLTGQRGSARESGQSKLSSSIVWKAYSKLAAGGALHERG
jgi:hypothetical protein